VKATYAAGTKVKVTNSHAEILRLLAKHGASDYGIADKTTAALVAFTIKTAKVRLRFPLPSHADAKMPWSIATWDSRTQSNRPFNPETDAARVDKPRAAKLEQATRERWRLIVLVLKTKLELVALGARTVEQEFLEGLVLPNGQTVAQEIAAEWNLHSALALPEKAGAS
jgi:hypothetical protein